MQSWYSKNLGDALLAAVPLNDIAQQFATVYAAAGCPAGMAVFVRHESEGRLHCEVVVYFSPATAALARQLGASPCRTPDPHDLGLLGGSDESRCMLFPPDTP